MNYTTRFLTTSTIVAALAILAGPQLCLVADEANQDLPKAATDRIGDALPQRALLRLGTQRFRHPSAVIDLALSPDEQTVVTIGSEELIVWVASTGKMQWRANLRERG